MNYINLLKTKLYEILRKGFSLCIFVLFFPVQNVPVEYGIYNLLDMDIISAILSNNKLARPLDIK